ncbi:phytanoyl-CoA dioxygenase family protein [Paenibacillus psychroresistens]|uniref:Phytanoyl-CoA dioxygenase family protein n=1 Tax=Paenibacillus psychroresistens TaxID=1778678 RepID=A0A6B8REF2_9BACL|nr:phytanoyl-CoA dioxygenase family protein [Paenibacillus psychroresistens]QGQ94104.1 phytanoyl-CoA dioxygenase family protein [Paenibacillus psychroresistens]
MSNVAAEQTISQEKINFYRENGFVQMDNLLSTQELEELREYMAEVMEAEGGHSTQTDKKGGTYYRVLNQKVNTWRDHGGMGKYSFHPRFAEIARCLTGAKGIRFFHDHALLKMPGDSKPTPWHQDLVFWPMNETGALSIWIALDDVDENNGCMMFVPKSHTAGKLTPINLVDPTDINEYVKGTEIAQQQPVKVPMKAGSCTFHDGLTFHYAHANVTEKPRRALAIIYMPDGTTYSGVSHLITDNLDLKENEPIRGRMFPLLAVEVE